MPTLNVDKLRASSIGAVAGPIVFGIAAVATVTLGFFALGGPGDSPVKDQSEIATLGSFGGSHQSESADLGPEALLDPVPTAMLATPVPTATTPPTPTPPPTATAAPAPTATTAPPAAAPAPPQDAASDETQAEVPSPAPTAESTEAPPPEPTAEAQPSAEAQPTASPEPTAEPQPSPTLEPTPEPQPTATLEPTAEPEPQEPAPGDSATAGLTDFSALEQQMLNRVNQVRSSIGVPPLTMISSLVEPSRVWANQMASGVGLVHCGDCAVAPLPDSCRGWGENIGMGPSMETIQEALEQSPGHYANMTEASYSQVGIGITTDSTGQMWLTQTFGTGC